MALFIKRKPRIAVISPLKQLNASPLAPFLGDENGRKWTYYHQCISRFWKVVYFDVSEFERVSGFAYVFVHEGLYDELGEEKAVAALRRIRSRNGKLAWVEMHEKSTFSGALFAPGFFEQIDLVLKHQLLEIEFLKEEIRRPVNRLAPHFLYGAKSFREFLSDRRYFDFRIPEELMQSHLDFDFRPVLSKIRPIMYPFSWKLASKGPPRYQSGAPKTIGLSYSGRAHPNHVQRNSLVAWLGGNGLPVTLCDDYIAALNQSRFFLALGHIHSSLRTFDVLAFDTVMVHYDAGPYLMWEEFRAGENFLGFGDPTKIFAPGGFGFDESYLRGVVARLSAEMSDESRLKSVLGAQRDLFGLVSDPAFMCAKLGIEVGDAR